MTRRDGKRLEGLQIERDSPMTVKGWSAGKSQFFHDDLYKRPLMINIRSHMIA